MGLKELYHFFKNFKENYEKASKYDDLKKDYDCVQGLAENFFVDSIKKGSEKKSLEKKLKDFEDSMNTIEWEKKELQENYDKLSKEHDHLHNVHEQQRGAFNKQRKELEQISEITEAKINNYVKSINYFKEKFRLGNQKKNVVIPDKVHVLAGKMISDYGITDKMIPLLENYKSEELFRKQCARILKHKRKKQK